MSGKSQIEWTEQTWNPTTGCTKVSAGCKHCYAETLAKRLCAMGASGYQNGFNLTLHESRLLQPLKRRVPTTYFVNSMSDLFHPKVPYSFLDQVMETISRANWHRFQILTKRATQMRRYFSTRSVPVNAWLGVSVENIRHGVPRIDILRDIECGIRFLSCEPLLEDIGTLDLSGIHWVIVGGESGARARPMARAWAVNIQEQCNKSKVAFFFKQWGAWGQDNVKRNKKNNGRLLNGQEWNHIPIVNDGNAVAGCA